MANKKMIFIDLDGTSLKDEKELHPDNVTALLKAKDQGHIVAIATGRPRRGAIAFYKQLKLDTPMININGAHISNPTDENFPEELITFSAQTVKDILSLPNVKGEYVDVMCEHKQLAYTTKRTSIFDDFHSIAQSEDVIIMDIEKELDVAVNSMIICIHSEEGQQAIHDFCNKNDGLTSITWSVRPDWPAIIEINNTTGNKGDKIIQLANLYGVEQKDTIAFGDMTNDIKMLQMAGIGVAMQNAHPDTKAVADVVMELDNTQGAVAAWLNKNLLK